MGSHMSDESDISWIIPTFNAVATIEKTLQSLQAQTHKTFQIIVMDGGSTDGTLDILRRYSGMIDILISAPDDGAPDALNKGFEQATGRYVGLIGGDDWLEPTACARLIEVIQQKPDIGVISYGVQEWQQTGMELQKGLRYCDPQGDTYTLENGLYGNGICRVYRQDVWQSVGEYDYHTYPKLSDRDWMIRLGLLAPSKHVITDTLYHFRRHGGSTTANDDPDFTVLSLKEYWQMGKRYYAKYQHTEHQQALEQWLGFTWVRLVYFLAKTKRIGQCFRYMLEGCNHYPGSVLKGVFRPRMPSPYKGKS